MMNFCLKALMLLISLGSTQALAARSVDLSLLSADQKQILLEQIPSLKGPEFLLSDLDKALEILIGAQGYDSAEIKMLKKGEDEIYIVVVARDRRISKITFSGNAVLSETDLRQELITSENAPFDENLLTQSAKRIQQIYSQKGYPQASLDLEFINSTPITTEVKITVREGPPTKVVRITALTKSKELAALSQRIFKGKLGAPLTESLLAEIRGETRELFSKNNFFKAELTNPQVIPGSNESELNLEYNIERSEKYKVYIDGYQKISRPEIDDALDLNHFFSSNPNIGPELATKLKSFYLSQGFSRAEVSYEESDSENELERVVKLNINEGPKVKISELFFSGKVSQDQSTYVDFVRKHSSDLVRNGYYNRDDIDSGLKKLIINLQNQGYLKARIINTRATYNRESASVFINVNMDEGPLTTLREIQFDGLQAFTQEQLLPIISLNIGEALKLSDLESSITKLKEFYHSQGYLEMRLTNEKSDLVIYNTNNTEAKIVYRIHEGPKIVVQAINIEGNSLTKDFVILKEIEFKAGDTLTPQNIEESRSRLQKLGLFASVDIKTLEENTHVSKRTVVIRVTDRDPGLFNLGIGVNNERNLTVRGFIGVAYRNLGGEGRGLSARVDANYNVADIKYLENKIALGYLEPYIFDSRTKLRVNFTRARQVSDYEKKIISEVNQTSYILEQDLTSHVTLSYEVYSLATVKDFQMNGDPSIFEDTSLDIATTGPTLDIDYRDHPFNPTRGSFTRFKIEYSAPWIGSNRSIEYLKSYASFSHYIPFGNSGWVWANNLRAGQLDNLAENGGVPYEKKGFTLGGQSTIRGFEAPEAFPGGFELGTDRYLLKTRSNMYLIKSEARFPIKGNFGGALFYDGGSVTIDGVDIDDPYRDCVGIAFRYSTPVGAVSLEWGWKLDTQDGRSERPVAFHFSIGTF